MKCITKKLAEFFQREWFLLVMIVAIGLVVLLFEALK